MNRTVNYIFSFMTFFLVACSGGPKADDEFVQQKNTAKVLPPGNIDDENPMAVKSDYYYLNSGGFESIEEIIKFVPGNYVMMDTCTGDLNRDKFDDLLLVLKTDGEDSTSQGFDKPEKRLLLIFIGDSTGLYQFMEQSDNIILCRNCGRINEDPYLGLKIKNGYFSVEQTWGGSWRFNRTTTFRYNFKDESWYLYKDGEESFAVVDPDKSSTTIYTEKDFGKVRFDEYDIYEAAIQ